MVVSGEPEATGQVLGERNEVATAAEFSPMLGEAAVHMVGGVAVAHALELRSSNFPVAADSSRRRLTTWRAEDVDKVDKTLIALMLVASAATAGSLAYLHTAPDFKTGNYRLGVTSPPYVQGMPEIPGPARPMPSAPIPKRVTDIHIPAAVKLEAPLAGVTDSLWREVSRTITIDGRQLSPRQVQVVTNQVMRDNDVRGEAAAQKLPVGFQAQLSRTVHRLVHSFSARKKI
jgi:hypothetical protein